jgi:hypothetical protein
MRDQSIILIGTQSSNGEWILGIALPGLISVIITSASGRAGLC